MKPLIFPRISLALALAAGLTAAVADTIKLKNGTIYNGTIVDDTADFYGMDVKVGKGIVDYKKIPKADVEKVEREMPDEREAEELNRYVLAGVAARKAGLGINAGHDLNLQNLPRFVAAIDGLQEVSIGHALIADALELGLDETVRRYRRAAQGHAK